ncbi:MAG: hypothetical protein ACR2O7_08645 [Parasphingorhabdus sp.]
MKIALFIAALSLPTVAIANDCQKLSEGQLVDSISLRSAVLKAKSAAITKDDFESQHVFEVRGHRKIDDVFGGNGELAVHWKVPEPYFDYDFPNQRFTTVMGPISSMCMIHNFRMSKGASHLSFGKQGSAATAYCLTDFGDNVTVGSFTGTNAFGVEADVESQVSEDFGIFLGVGNYGQSVWNYPAKESFRDVRRFNFEISPEAGRSFLNNGRAIAIIVPQPPAYFEQSTIREATIRSRREVRTTQKFIAAGVRCIALVDTARNKVVHFVQLNIGKAPVAASRSPDFSKGAVPKGRVEDWLAEYSEYADTFEYTLSINGLGQVETCRVIKSTGDVSRDERMCLEISRRALFTPAEDSRGWPTQGVYQSNQ